MIKPIFKPESDIENCLTNDFNIEIYEALTENKGRKLLFDPLEFLNLLYEQNLIVLANKNKPLSVVKHLLELNLSNEQRYFFLLHLIHLIDIILSENSENLLMICRNFINKEYKKIEDDLFPAEVGNPTSVYEKSNSLDNYYDEIQKNVPFIGNLLNNLNLNELILDYYYRLVPQPVNREEISKHYVGKLNRYNSPYQLSIYGAYVNMNDWEFLNVKIENKYPPFDNISNAKFENAQKKYALGFMNGYYNFEKDNVEVSLFQESSNRAKIIFDFAIGRMFTSSGFPESYGENVHILDGWSAAGKEGGYIYRAWYLILQNHNVFTPLFEKLRNQNIIDKPLLSIEQQSGIGQVTKVTKTQYLMTEFRKNGFFELEKIKDLPQNVIDQLFKLLIENKLPYIVAMLDYLGFIKYLSKEHYQINNTLNKKISEWFESDKDGRAVRGNRTSLLKPDRRYTADKHKESVEKDYASIK